MDTITMKHFDVIAYAKQLRSVGFSQEQADVQAQAIENVMSNINEVTTTHDLATKSDLAITEAKLLSAMKDQEIRLIKWVLSSSGATILALAGLLKYIH